MGHEENKVIIQYLTILELPLDRAISKEIVKAQYRKLVHVYHPDASIDVYQDGERFKLLQRAYEYLIEDVNYVNSAISRNFENSSSFNYSRSYSYNEPPKESHSYQPKPAYSSKANNNSADSMITNNWLQTKNFHLVSSILGAVLAVFIFFFGFIGYVCVTNYEGVYPTGGYVHHWYNLYESTAESYGVYHCAVAFNFVVIGFLLVGLIVAVYQKKNDCPTLKGVLLRIVLNFLTFGLAIPLAVFHMIVADGDMYATGSGGEIVLAVFTWLIIALQLVKTIVSLVPLLRFVFSKMK